MSDILIETKLVKDPQMNEEMNEQVNRAKESYFRWLDSFNRGDFAGMLDLLVFHCFEGFGLVVTDCY